MPEDEFDKSFSTLISKLGHPVEEIRLRALDSLQGKLNLKLISDVDILQYKYLYIKLLEWFNFPSPPKRDVVLKILLKLSKNESAAYHLHSIGAVNFFNSLRIDLTPELERCVDEILENILSQHFVTSPTSNLSRSSSSSCQLLKSTTPTELGNSSMFQLPLTNLSHYQPAELSSYRQERSRSTSQTLTNQSGTRGILKLSVPSMTNLMTTLDDHVLKSPGNQFITVFPTIHLMQSDRTVLSNLENALLSRDDPSNIVSHCHFLSNVVLNDFPAELFLQRSFLLKRLLALINENNDDLIKAALVCLKDYAFHLQRRIKILRDPACFCPNVQINTDRSKENFHDEFNNTLNSARSVSSIHSTTSNGYRHPIQWSLKHDEPSTVEQPAPLDILDFCYSVLIGTFDLLRRLTIKDCLHVCLQLNNSICEIIDLFVRHNYGVMNAEFYSLLFFRLHSLIKQQLTTGSTFHSRTIYIHALHVFSALLHTIELSDEVVQQFSQEFYELIYYILMDECFHLAYPHIRERLLPIAEQFDKDNYQVYTKSNEVCQSFAAACQILTNDETKSKISIQFVRWANDALLGLPYHLNFSTIKKFVNVCSKISSKKSNVETSEINYSIDILMKYLTHELAEIRSATYYSIAMLVASRLSIEETVKSNKKSRKNPNEVSDFDEVQFVCNFRVLAEICIRGMNDLATKVADHSRLILLHLLQSKLIVSAEFWKDFITTIAGILPQLQCYASKVDPLGQCILNLSSDTEKERESLLTLNQRLQASLRYLFSKDKDVQRSGYRQCVGYVLSNTRLRLDDFYQFYPPDKLFDLFANAKPTLTDENSMSEHANIENFLRVYAIFTDRTNIDVNVRKSALEQISNMLEDPSLHTSFINHGGLERILDELRSNVKRDDLTCSTDYNSMIPACVKILRLFIQFNRNIQKKFSVDNEILKLIFKTSVCCHNDLSIVSNCSHALVLLLFDRSLHPSASNEQLSQHSTFSIDFLIAKHFQFPTRFPVQSSAGAMTTSSLNRPDPLRENIVEQKFRFVWNTLWHGTVEDLDRDMDKDSFENDEHVDFQDKMILTENDRKCFSLTFTKRTIRIQLNLLNESNNHESMIETLNALRCLLLLVTHDNVHLIDFKQLATILDRFFQIVPSSSQDEKLLQFIFDFLEQISYGFHVSIKETDEEFFDWFKTILLNPFISLLASNKDFNEMRQTKRDLMKKLFRFLSSFYAHPIVSNEFFTERLFSTILVHIQQSKSQTLSKLTLISGAMDVLQQITAKPKWFVIFDNDFLRNFTNLFIGVIETFHEGRQEASSSFMAHALIRSSSQILLNTILALKTSLSDSNRRPEMSTLGEWLDDDRDSFQWLRNLWFYSDVEIRTTAFAIAAVLVSEQTGREILFSAENRLDETHLVSILLNEDECSSVKEQISNIFINLTFTLIDDETKLATNNGIITVPDLISAFNDCDFMQRMGSNIFSNLYPFVALDFDALRANQTTASPASPLLVANICSLLFNMHLLNIRHDTPEFIELLLSFLDVRPLESKINKNVTTNEYRFFMENMFYMNTKITQYLRLIYETNVDVFNKTMNNENSIQILALLAHFPDEIFDRSEHFWQMKINLAHFIVQILLQQTSGLNPLINRTIAENGGALLSLLSLPLPKLINGSSSAAISIVLHLLSLSIAQSTFDQEQEIWRKFFDQSSETNGAEIFDQLFVIYENRLNAEANDSLKLTVSNMIKSLLNVSSTAKHRAIQKGFIESQIDHLKRVQTKLTLFSLQSDKCVSKDEILIDECVQVLAILNNLAFNCVEAKEIISNSGLIPFLHQLWCWAVVDVQLLNIILLLLTTLTAKHRKGCLSVCSTVLPSTSALAVRAPDQQRPLSNLLSYVLRLISKSSISSATATNPSSNKNQTIEMAFDLVQNCSMEIEGRSLVYKSNFYQTIIDHFERVSRDIHRFDRRFLDILTNISFFPDGQTSILKNPQLFSIAVRVAQSSTSSILQRQAVLILRNLAFSSTNKTRLVSDTKYISTLMSHVVAKSSDTIYIGLTGLWALVADAQKSKVAVRSSNVLPALYDVKIQQKNKENLPCYHAVSNIIQLLTED